MKTAQKAIVQSASRLASRPESRPVSRPPGLVAADFRCIARNGFGEPENSYSHSMAWFRGHIYVSTTRNAICGPKPFASDLERLISMYPVQIPDTNPWDNDFRSQIWRYDPVGDEWAMVHRSDVWRCDQGFDVPRQIGFRSMTTHQGGRDREPALYAASWSTRMGPGPIIMRCADGEHFEEVSDPGFGGRVTQGVRGLTSFREKLFAATTMRCGSRDTVAEETMVYVSENPVSNEWHEACPPSFGDPTNLSVYDMHVFDGHLYAATLNPSRGFQLWKTDAEGKPPYRWKRVLTDGAYRGNFNETVTSMGAFDGCLYVGSAIQNCGHDRIFRVGPAAPEMLRVYPDDSWELLVGAPRNTPEGMKVPLSGMGPGFGSGMAGYMWRTCAHDGWLYVATADRLTFLRYIAPEALPEHVRWASDPDFVDSLLHEYGGLDMWRTCDGVQWFPVTRNGFGNQFNLGGRTMVSTPRGLFVGTANLFGPTVAVRRAAGWVFELNPDGGTEVWLGRREETGDRPGPLERDADRIESCSAGCDDLEDDVLRELYGGSEFRYCGFWRAGTLEPRQACETLIDELVAFTRPRAVRNIPVPSTDEEDIRFFEARKRGLVQKTVVSGSPRRAAVLELGCGRGAATCHLVRHFASDCVTAVSDDRADLRICERDVPGVRFVRSKLTRLKLESDTFDYVFCVEVADRGVSRDKLVREARRVLKPGGFLIGSDFLVAERSSVPSLDRPSATTVDGYIELLKARGYDQVRIVDTTRECWVRFQLHTRSFLSRKLLTREIDQLVHQNVLDRLPGASLKTTRYVLFSARKPDSSGGESPATEA